MIERSYMPFLPEITSTLMYIILIISLLILIVGLNVKLKTIGVTLQGLINEIKDKIIKDYKNNARFFVKNIHKTIPFYRLRNKGKSKNKQGYQSHEFSLRG